MKNTILLIGFSFVLLITSCSSDSKKESSKEMKEEKNEVIIKKEMKEGDAQKADANLKIVDDFYVAITARDSANLINCLDEDCKMYGTDPSEDWNLDQVKTYISEKAKETSTKAVFKVKKREVRIMNDFMYVVDVLDVSTTAVPFRCVTITKKSKDGDKITMAEFSALVKNEDMKKVAEFFK
ncbi:MAG: nuclear transport factor 2 family protein [Bacteroidetes bacterium]|nr:nuclear transport factor 2 family protein [Bacteroidota bacterium]